MNQFVYVLEDTQTGLLKIGISTEPERRARNVSREFGCTAVVRGILKTEDARRTEQFLHNMLAGRRVVGEWFDVPEHERGYLLAYFSDVEGQQEQANLVTLPRLTPPEEITPEWIQAAVLVLGSYRNISILFGIRGQYLSQMGQQAGIHRRPRLGADKKAQAREMLAAGQEPRQVARELGMAPVSAWRLRREIEA